MTNQIYFVYILRVKKKFPTFETRRKLCPLFLRDTGASETRACVKITPREKGEHAAQGERKMRDYRQTPSFWTYALLSQRRTLIGSSMEICQHLSKRASSSRETAERKKLVSGVSFTCNKLNIPRNLPMTRAMIAQWEKETHWMRSIELKGYTNFTLQNRSTLNRERSQAWALSVVPHFSVSAPLLAFLAGVIFTRARISLALLSL